MRKTLTLIVLFLLGIVFHMKAQSQTKRWNYAIKGGYTAANMIGENVAGSTFLNGNTPDDFYANHPASSGIRHGFNIGLGVVRNFTDAYALRLEANYSQKGSRTALESYWNGEESLPAAGNAIWKQNYVSIPLMGQVSLGRWKTFFISAGMFTGFLINAEETGDIKLSGTPYSYTNDRGANEFEVGALAGIGYQRRLLGKRKIQVELRGNWSSISYGRNLDPNPDRYYNQSVDLTFGYLF